MAYLETLRDVLPPTGVEALDFDGHGDVVVTDQTASAPRPASPRFTEPTSDPFRTDRGPAAEDRAESLDQRAEVAVTPTELSTSHAETTGASSLNTERQLTESISVEARPGRINNPVEERVLFSGLRMPNADVAVRRLLKEAQDIPIVDAPNVCGVLLRVIVELAATELVQVANLRLGKQTLKETIRGSLLRLDPQCHDEKARNPALHLAWVRSQEDGALSVRTMQDYVHHLSVDALVTDVRNLSKTYRPMLELIDAELGKLKPRP